MGPESNVELFSNLYGLRPYTLNLEPHAVRVRRSDEG
jgi:hypothetical protein